MYSKGLGKRMATYPLLPTCWIRMPKPLLDPPCWMEHPTCWTYGYTIANMVDPTFTRSFISSLFVWAVMDNGRRCLDVHLVLELPLVEHFYPDKNSIKLMFAPLIRNNLGITQKKAPFSPQAEVLFLDHMMTS